MGLQQGRIVINTTIRGRGLVGREDRVSETRIQRGDSALIDAFSQDAVRRLARNADGLSDSSLVILTNFATALRRAEKLFPETADL